ncbi:hypothetical protein NZD89_20345 [Alicyclobacillus fastidiosus]|uniref:Uncharacterized protein n=1 Tax=Alicyclobacillus fastidiosus TaxID=392011 RepID=A0ABY6ZES3_9BACL|nr:hypothetical protein [Alicyclobacillus fastidiosus]WAH40640.1 hypothetical protein NZD89_20345 [Alicyclobacillus fastidiosus]GMA62087.1 hypothetical protein GCM10025859_25270 [Alicyclobacillus fastidiosus]
MKFGDQVSVTTSNGTTYTGVFAGAFDNKIIIFATSDVTPSGVAETIIDLTGAVVQLLSNQEAPRRAE